jgi:nucleotide-binding universal stress UspA family protein
MFKHILIATDGSQVAELAAVHGIKLGKLLNAKVTAVMVTKPWAKVIAAETAEAFPYEDYERAATNEAKTILAKISEMAKKA